MKRVVEYFQRFNSSDLSDKVTSAYEMYQIALVNFSSIDNNNMTRNKFIKSIYKNSFESLVPNLTIMQLYEMSIPISIQSLFLVVGNKLNEDGSTSYIKHKAHPSIESIMMSFLTRSLLRKCLTLMNGISTTVLIFTIWS